MSSDQRYSSKRAYNKRSSTRATLREEKEQRDMIIRGLRRKLKESKDVINDLKNLVDLNREAMGICSVDQKGEELLKPLRKENRILLEGLIRNLTFQEKFGLMVERYKNMMEESEKRMKLIQDDMAGRMGNMMVKLAYYEKECRFEEMAKNFCQDLDDILARKKTLTAVKNFGKKIKIAVVWKDKVKKLEMEKKELLRVNFDLSSEIMKMKALLSTSKGYKDFMYQNKELMPENIKENFGEQVNKIISFHKQYLRNRQNDSDEDVDDEDEQLSENFEVFETEMLDETIQLETEEAADFNNRINQNFSLALPKLTQGNVSNAPSSNTAALSFKLDLSKAMDMQERMTKKMMDKAIKEKNKNRTRLEKAEIIQEKYDKLDKEHTRILKLLNEEMETTNILGIDNRRLKKMNKELLNINQILAESNKKCEKRRRHLEKNIVIFRRAYMAFNFFLTESKELMGRFDEGDENQFVLNILHLLGTKYDPEKDYVIKDESNNDKVLESDSAKKRLTALDLGRARALANHLHEDVSKNKLVKKVEEGETLIPSHRNEGRTRSYSDKGSNLEEMQEEFEKKMEDEDKGNVSFED